MAKKVRKEHTMTEREFLHQLLHVLALNGVNGKQQAREMIEERLNERTKCEK